MEPILPTAEEASAEAVHSAKNAAAALESARQAQITEALQIGQEGTKKMLLDVLREVFGEGDNKDPDQMKILIRRIPLICTQIEKMHTDIAWSTKLLTYAIFILIPIFGWFAATTVSNNTQLAAVNASVEILINQR